LKYYIQFRNIGWLVDQTYKGVNVADDYQQAATFDTFSDAETHAQKAIKQQPTLYGYYVYKQEHPNESPRII
jgi:hypothetical protein